MSTSYPKNIHLSNFGIQIQILNLFTFQITGHYCIMEILKKMGKNKNKCRKIYSKNHEHFKNSKPRVQFYWFL